jgi:hypothetical protein
MVGAGDGMFDRLGLSGLGQATELVVRPTVVRAGMAGEAAQTDHAQVNSSALVRSTFAGRVTQGVTHFAVGITTGAAQF